MRRGERVASRFEILGEAGRGGMGTVFRARDHRSKRDVALKVLAVRGRDSVARFEREAAILSQLHHPNVVEYVAHGVVPSGPCWLVMEWVDGETLTDRLDRVGIDARETVALAAQVASALAALHALGIVHRDVKPSNLMLIGGDPSKVKLVDFGVARRTAELDRLTRTGAMIGTAGYMAPEQARGDHIELDGRADLFALGCVMHECLTGTPTFRGESTLACRAKVLLHDPPRVRKIAPELPAALEAIVASLLMRAADDRPARAADVAAALLALGDVPPIRVVRVAHAPPPRNEPTAVGGGAELCGVLVVGEGAFDAVAAISDARVESLDGGVIVLVDDVARAAALAVALATRLPDALLAVTADTGIDAVIDRGARMLDELVIAADARGVTARGAWIDPPLVDALGGRVAFERDGVRVRLRGGTS